MFDEYSYRCFCCLFDVKLGSVVVWTSWNGEDDDWEGDRMRVWIDFFLDFSEFSDKQVHWRRREDG